MSRSIHKPWIEKFLHDLLSVQEDTPVQGGHRVAPFNLHSIWPRCVQIIGINIDLKSITISDTEVYLHTFLTKDCFDELLTQYSVDVLKYSQVNLMQFCLSTVVQVSGNRDFQMLKTSLPLPLAFHCFKLTYLGGSECNIIGNPTSVHASKKTAQLLKNYRYFELRDRLAAAQFPLIGSLPDWGTCSNNLNVKPAHDNLLFAYSFLYVMYCCLL
jgi:hypothetical protein